VTNARKDEKVKCVRLYVETDNERAIAVYEKLGMSRLDNLEFIERDLVL